MLRGAIAPLFFLFDFSFRLLYTNYSKMIL
nr:MAG TPA: hypothetical protein [Caudoviricetes sp.]